MAPAAAAKKAAPAAAAKKAAPAGSKKAAPRSLAALVRARGDLVRAALPPGKAVALILRGVPGSGKTTLARHLAAARRPRGARAPSLHSADDFFETAAGGYQFDPARLEAAHGACFRGFVEALRGADMAAGGLVAVVHNTGGSAWEVEPYRAAAIAYGAAPLIVRLDVPLEVAFARQAHGVPLEAAKGIGARLGAPLHFPARAVELVLR
jgi:hypothetical protein